MVTHGPESKFSDDFTDGYETHLAICGACGLEVRDSRHVSDGSEAYVRCDQIGSVPTEEITNEEITDMTDEAIEITDTGAIPEFISNDSPTAEINVNDPYNSMRAWDPDGPTSPGMVIPTNDNDKSEAA